MAQSFDYLIVGAGYAGSVLAERRASGRKRQVLVVEKRPHIASNAFDTFDENGILIHRDGPHIFHTKPDPLTYFSTISSAHLPTAHSPFTSRRTTGRWCRR
ncbi:MAG: UDP-galactopyranose mutase [uncultured Truepera sp.]|uniref:UDP-galactopyranose mutase n=1 Tax=uncultured Truepera sp. TaxID=543023 RepID=A0A6J4VS63_9DEIN|nr:MAG: UDP-galactopyranose mutase [uncultured Truepera sp.]